MVLSTASLPSYVATLRRSNFVLTQLIKRDFSLRYRGSLGGALWSVISPMLLLAVYTFMFGVVFQSRWGDLPPGKGTFSMLLYAGMLVHSMFAEVVSRAPTLVLSQPGYVKKLIFPLEILPVVVVANALINAGIGFLLLVVFNTLLGGGLHPTLLLLPLVFLPYAVLVTGLALFLSALGVFVRDLTHAIAFVVAVSIFITPVFYPLNAVPEPYRPLMYLNPLTFVVEQTRGLVLFGDMPDWGGLIIYVGISSLVLWAGLSWFQRSRNGFADVM
jgi:lipopolysaccharide transport system permease protein